MTRALLARAFGCPWARRGISGGASVTRRPRSSSQKTVATVSVTVTRPGPW